MPQLNPAIIGFLAVVANILVQAIKNLIREDLRRYLPLGLMASMSAIGLGRS